MSAPRLILASASPRRADLLASLGVNFCAQPADIDESMRPGEFPRDYVRRMAQTKAAAVVATGDQKGFAVLAADTIVVLDGKVLGKPRDHSDGLAHLHRLSGRWHTVTTAVCLHTHATMCLLSVATDVQFMTLSEQACEAYLATDEPWDKAGCYAIQGLGGAFVQEIRGSYSNVVGLPLAQTWQLLREHGIATALEPLAGTLCL